MVKESRILIFIIGFLCAWILFSANSKKVAGESLIPPSVIFSGGSNVIYFLDREDAILYRYNTQGRLTRSYIIKELGKDLQSK